jgi:spore maturation protein CgeB
MRFFVVHPGADTSTSDVFDGLTGALKRAGHEVLVYQLSGLIDHAGSWLTHLYKRRRKALRDAEDAQGLAELPRPTPADVIYQAVSGVFERVIRYQPDVVLAVSAMWFPPDAIILLRRLGVPVATVLTESPYEDAAQEKVAALSSIVWTNERESLAPLRLANPLTFYLPHAFDPDRHQTTTVEGEETDLPAHDVVFVGTGFEERVEVLQDVDWSGIDLGLYGNWQLLGSRSKLRQYVRDGNVPNTVAAALYRRAKIGLNLHRSSMGFGRHAPHIESASSLNPRAYELAATGSFYLSDERAEGQELFGDLVPTFTSPRELQDLVRRYLADDAARAALAARLPAAIAGQTFDARAAQIVSDLRRSLWS